ncbi:hypothetical protein NH8B_0584 [Pseudogulbenkiania sp. NH8B]|uniref:hypothetical protein n=1 Tax=Pseudogulbenkiania sp. (strain NH8B) TaxID=748280 RepID=UPI0002279588|nr:hypothetical protein [Pseudogulbenkiania sp. NH8B]BAK75419.1 hypothetical protein NH8B_0584 [Pseudogulbenkiania sp. NH8B]
MKTLLIIGAKGSGKSSAAQVAAQIAMQHHGADSVLHELDDNTTRSTQFTREAIRIVVKTTPSRGKVPATRVLNMDHFARHPRGRAVTFAIREAVDACLAAH